MPKLYTKKGDNGVTSLYDGTKLPKKSDIFDVLGDLDELGSNIGLLCSKFDNPDEYLREIQVKLLDIGSNIAVLDDAKRKSVPEITEDDVKKIESCIDQCEQNTGKLTEFLLCGVGEDDAQCHVCRSISRRVERSMWKINGSGYDKLFSENPNIMKYMNRLSDFFFAYARVLSIGYEEIKVSDIKKKLVII